MWYEIHNNIVQLGSLKNFEREALSINAFVIYSAK